MSLDLPPLPLSRLEQSTFSAFEEFVRDTAAQASWDSKFEASCFADSAAFTATRNRQFSLGLPVHKENGLRIIFDFYGGRQPLTTTGKCRVPTFEEMQVANNTIAVGEFQRFVWDMFPFVPLRGIQNLFASMASAIEPSETERIKKGSLSFRNFLDVIDFTTFAKTCAALALWIYPNESKDNVESLRRFANYVRLDDLPRLREFLRFKGRTSSCFGSWSDSSMTSLACPLLFSTTQPQMTTSKPTLVLRQSSNYFSASESMVAAVTRDRRRQEEMAEQQNIDGASLPLVQPASVLIPANQEQDDAESHSGEFDNESEYYYSGIDGEWMEDKKKKKDKQPSPVVPHPPSVTPQTRRAHIRQKMWRPRPEGRACVEFEQLAELSEKLLAMANPRQMEWVNFSGPYIAMDLHARKRRYYFRVVVQNRSGRPTRIRVKVVGLPFVEVIYNEESLAVGMERVITVKAKLQSPGEWCGAISVLSTGNEEVLRVPVYFVVREHRAHARMLTASLPASTTPRCFQPGALSVRSRIRGMLGIMPAPSTFLLSRIPRHLREVSSGDGTIMAVSSAR